MKNHILDWNIKSLFKELYRAIILWTIFYNTGKIPFLVRTQ